MKVNTLVASSTLVIGLIIALVTLLVPTPIGWQDAPVQFHIDVALYAFMACMHVGAALLFALSLNVYKAKLRLAFTGIMLGILLIAIGTVQLTVLDALDLWEIPYVTYGFVTLPFLISGIVMYFGAASFSRLVGLKSVLTNKFVVMPAVVLFALASTALPHVQVQIPERTFDAGNMLLVWVLLLDTTSALLALRIRNHVGAHYVTAITWLSLGLLGSSTCVALSLVFTLLLTDIHHALYLILTCVTVATGLAWLRAGYLFRATKEY